MSSESPKPVRSRRPPGSPRTGKRAYTLRARAEQQAATRARIAAVTAELHAEVGPARTTVAEIARRAGVQRLTVYNHFPEERELFAACQRHFMDEHPFPDLEAAFGDPDPVRAVLERVYGWYRATRGMTENVNRDRAAVPALDALLAETRDVRFAQLAAALGGDAGAGRAAAAVALEVATWQRLDAEGLGDGGAAALMAHLVRAAQGVSPER